MNKKVILELKKVIKEGNQTYFHLINGSTIYVVPYDIRNGCLIIGSVSSWEGPKAIPLDNIICWSVNK